MTTVIRLDKSALQFLLQELGDEFLLEIRQTVAKELIGKTAETTLGNDLAREIREAVNAEVKLQVTERPWAKYPTLTDAIKDAIESRVKVEIVDTILSAIQNTDLVAKYEERVDSMIEWVQKQVRIRVLNKVSDWALQEAEMRLQQLKEADG